MSKSLGNVINPIDVIKEFGSDALRMGIIAGRAPAVNRGYDSRKVQNARNFCNKLWNVARFIEDQVGDDFHLKAAPKAENTADALGVDRVTTYNRESGCGFGQLPFLGSLRHGCTTLSGTTLLIGT